MAESALAGYIADEKLLYSRSMTFPMTDPAGRCYGLEDCWQWQYIPTPLREKVTNPLPILTILPLFCHLGSKDDCLTNGMSCSAISGLALLHVLAGRCHLREGLDCHV